MLAAAPAPAVAAKKKPCRPSGSKALWSDGKVRVYYLYRNNRDVRYTYGCRYKDGKPVQLLIRTTEDPDYLDDFYTDPSSVHVAGNFVALVFQICSGDERCDQHIDLTNLKTRKSDYHGLDAEDSAGDYFETDIGSFALSRRGVVAWITEVDTKLYTATRWQLGDELVELEKSSAIDPESMRLSFDRTSFTWLSGGVQKTAPVTP